MTFKQTLKTRGNKKITFELPDEFKNVKEIVITVYDKKSSDELIEELELAMKDPDFISDMREVSDDFKFIDSELK